MRINVPESGNISPIPMKNRDRVGWISFIFQGHDLLSSYKKHWMKKKFSASKPQQFAASQKDPPQKDNDSNALKNYIKLAENYPRNIV